jgi:hypothetical protein
MRKLAWFIAIWLMGVGLLGGVAFLIRTVIYM